MGIQHLEEIRNFLKDNREKSYSRTFLRDFFKHNYTTILENLEYLIEVENVVEKIIVKEHLIRYKWKGRDTNGKLQKRKGKKTQSNT